MPLLAGLMSGCERAQLARAQRRLAPLELYPYPVRMRHVRLLRTPWFFQVPGLRRFHGYELGPLILVRDPLDVVDNDLVVHELCHVWQDQHRRVYMWTSYLWQGYRNNEHEVEARRAASATRHIP